MLHYILKDIIFSLISIGLVGGAVFMILRLNKDKIWKEHLRNIWANKLARYSFIVICFYVLIFLLDTITFPVFKTVSDKSIYSHSRSLLEVVYSPVKEESYSAPFAEYQLTDKTIKNKQLHIAGTNINGEDVFFNALKSIKVAFTIGILTLLLVIPIGIFGGLMAGYFGKRVDMIITYIYSTLSSIPSILLLIVLMKILGNGMGPLSISLGITSWAGLCRIIRGETIKQKNIEYVQAGRALGLNHLRIAFGHILPNIMHIVLISSILRFSALIMTEVILSYLGLGVAPETISWGRMIDQARMELARAPVVWWNITTAFLFMFVLILSVNFLGDVIRDVLDPRTLKKGAKS